MTIRTVHPDRGLPELGPELDQAWRDWLARHGLPSADDIPARSPIVCDDSNRTITVERWIRNERGNLQLRLNGHDRTCDLLREIVTVQLEAQALPIPDGYRVSIDA